MLKRACALVGLIPMLLHTENEPVSINFNEMPQQQMELPAFELVEKKKSVLLTVGLSSLVPGLGHTYLGEYGTASGIFCTYAGAFYGSVKVDALRTFPLAVNTYWYGIYAAYRDVRNFNGQENYEYAMPTETLAELSYAPFNYKVMRKPEVWGGLLGAFALASASMYLHNKSAQKNSAASVADSAHIISAFPIGIGEEAYFRGYLQSALMKPLTPWGAISVSTLAFGAAHIPNAFQYTNPYTRRAYFLYSLPIITGIGLYNGWLAYKNTSLKECVALHAWYDFALFALAASASGSIAGAEPQFAITIPF